jgi:hypothetical protein
MRPAGGNHKTLRKYVERVWQISTTHFDPERARNEALRRDPIALSVILVADSTYPRGHLKERLFRVGLKTRICEMCGQDEMWRERRMALILDHINGVANDHRLENLRIVCPNCAATLDTHCGRQNRLGRSPRDCLHCGEEFRPGYPSQRYCSRYCGVRHGGDGGTRPERRKVIRPSHQQLVSEIRELGFTGTGRRHGVSDNAVRKWIGQYERAHAGWDMPIDTVQSARTGIASLQ